MSKNLLEIILPIVILSVLGFTFGVVIAIISRKFKVEDESPNAKLIKEFREMLPGYNCGSCGTLSCDDFASKIVNEHADPHRCRPMKKDRLEEVIKKIQTELQNKN